MQRVLKQLALALILVEVLAAKDKYDPTTLVYPTFLHTLGIRKATKTHLMIYTRNRVKVNDPQGLAVVRLLSWDDPSTPKDDDEVTGYGVNSGANMIVYNTSMTSLAFYGPGERGVRALNRPRGIAANEVGDVYLADTGNDRVVRFLNRKKKLEFVRGIGGTGSLPGQFLRPEGVALDSRGMVYVTDTGNHRVQILRPDNQLHLWFGKQGVAPGELWHPSGIAVTDPWQKWSYYKDGFIALVDLDYTRLQKFTLDGQFVKAIRLQDFGYESGHLAYVAIDYYSNIWVTDQQNHQIHKFDRNLNYLTSFGRHGNGDKEFNEPRGIAIRRRFGQVFVAEKESAQYYWIGTDVFNYRVAWQPETDAVAVSFFLTEPSYVTLRVKEKKRGAETRQLFAKQLLFSGAHTLYFDRNWRGTAPGARKPRGSNGDEAAYRKFEVQLKIEPTYSSYQYFEKTVEATVEIP